MVTMCHCHSNQYMSLWCEVALCKVITMSVIKIQNWAEIFAPRFVLVRIFIHWTGGLDSPKIQ